MNYRLFDHLNFISSFGFQIFLRFTFFKPSSDPQGSFASRFTPYAYRITRSARASTFGGTLAILDFRSRIVVRDKLWILDCSVIG